MSELEILNTIESNPASTKKKERKRDKKIKTEMSDKNSSEALNALVVQNAKVVSLYILLFLFLTLKSI